MSEESTTPDLVKLTRTFYETMDRDWDFDALAGFFAPDAVWDLSSRILGATRAWRRSVTRALCTVAMLATLGQQLQLGVYVQAARRRGATEQEIREVLRQVAVYAGFPNAWNALAAMKAALERFHETVEESEP